MFIKKLSIIHSKRKNNSGIILLLVIWVLVILTLLAVSLGRNTSIELSLTKYSVGKIKSKYIAIAGYNYALDKIRQDKEDEVSSSQDSLLYCGIPQINELTLEEIFSNRKLGEGYFNIQYEKDNELETSESVQYGFQDEDRKLNINSLNELNAESFKSLMILLGVSEEESSTIAYSTVDWKDKSESVSNENYGAEEDYYAGLDKPYHCKNAKFDSLQELLLVRGMTKEIYDKIKDYITIYPKDSNSLAINFNTVSEIVLKAIARGVATVQRRDIAVGDSIAEKLLEYRRGDDGIEPSEDDVVMQNISEFYNSLDSKEEQILFQSLQIYIKKSSKSDYLNINVIAKENNFNVESNINAIVNVNNLSVVYWMRN